MKNLSNILKNHPNLVRKSARKNKRKVSKKGKDYVQKIKFYFTNISQFYRWMQEIPMVLSKCNLPPRTFMMEDEEFDAYFAAINNVAMRKEYPIILNH